MLIELYSIYDRVAGLYGQPLFAVNRQTAERQFNYTMSQAQMVAGDCDLYYLGKFDNQTGVIEVLEKPEFVCHSEMEV